MTTSSPRPHEAGPAQADPSEQAPWWVGTRNQNPPGIGLLRLIREDYVTHDRNWLSQGWWTLALHRFGNWRMSFRYKLLRAPLSLVYKLFYPFTHWVCGIQLDYTTKVGRRVKLEHFGGMILVAREIGDDVTIRQNTTFGIVRKSEPYSKPIIEDRVDIGCGVAILGGVRVGHDSVIGANAVVVRDVPPYSVVVGVPGRVIKTLNPEADPL